MPPYAAFEDAVLVVDENNSSFCIHDDQLLSPSRTLTAQDHDDDHRICENEPTVQPTKSVRFRDETDNDDNKCGGGDGDGGLRQVRWITPAASDMTLEELNAIWYSATEFHQIKESLLESIGQLNQYGRLRGAPHEDTTRGLEYFTYRKAMQRECQKLRMQRVVLDEQERQRRLAMERLQRFPSPPLKNQSQQQQQQQQQLSPLGLDDEKIARLAALCSIVSRQEARDRAQQTEDFTLDIRQEEIIAASHDQDDCYYDMMGDEEEDELLLKQAFELRPILSLCCRDWGFFARLGWK